VRVPSPPLKIFLKAPPPSLSPHQFPHSVLAQKILFSRSMNLSNKNLTKLERLYFDGQEFLNKFYPKYKPRSQDEGHFNLWAASELRKEQPVYEKWYKSVLTTLRKDIKSDYYAAWFSKTRNHQDINVLPPDAFYYGIGALTEIIAELRKLQLAQQGGKLPDTTAAKLTAHFIYREPQLVLEIDEPHSVYLIHQFRKGKPKTLVQFALGRPDKRATSSYFRPGGIGGESIKENFRELFKQFFEDEKFKHSLIEHFLEVTPSVLTLNIEPLIITARQAHNLHRHFKKLE
jgi:hypothetical protein